ncbi:MAG: IS110 family transposase [Candidatus Dadabacteria bacterium]|nr:IS110 family transposase [Candidatus Dadabacteria bacterium]
MNPIFIGIDWADQKHDICITDNNGKTIKEFQIIHNVEGFAKFDNQLNIYDKNQIRICIETNSGLFFDHLIQFEYRVYSVNPGALVDYRKSHSLSGSKNDKLDAKLLSNYLRENVLRLKEYQRNSEHTRILKLLTEDRQRLLKERIRLENQLINTLKLYYPTALKLFCDLTGEISLKFLIKYSTPQKATRLTLEKLKTFLKQNKYSNPKRIDDIFLLLKEKQPSAPKVFVQAKEYFIQSIIPLIKIINKQIKNYDKEIKKHYEQHPDINIFNTLPGVGKIIGPRLLACFGDQRDQFPHFNNIQCLAGTAPVTKRSGKYCHVYFRFACNKFFRNTMHDLAFCSLSFSVWARAYYDKQKLKGHTHSEALRALSNKWLKIIHCLWMKRLTYDENYHLAQITRRNLEAAVMTN